MFFGKKRINGVWYVRNLANKWVRLDGPMDGFFGMCKSMRSRQSETVGGDLSGIL